MVKEIRNNYQDNRLDKIEKHLEVLNREFGKTQTDVAWIKKMVFILIPILASMIVSLISIFLKL